MRVIQLAGVDLAIHASPVTPAIYEQEFPELDMLSDVATMVSGIDEDGHVDLSVVRLFGIVKMAWAMARTVDFSIPSFSVWLADLPDGALDISVLDIDGIAAEAVRGFFRGGTGEAGQEAHGATE